ncbi:hypothetical protein QFZ46_001696 [Microbacterium murale]|uniref:Uncharacterized protein n=1 Tax=Microbacterium murale TaxID=1081040 RepID=A0ABU0P867_9MICO|nr:hypothetical protein [Microbacterium murale]
MTSSDLRSLVRHTGYMGDLHAGGSDGRKRSSSRGHGSLLHNRRDQHPTESPPSMPNGHDVSRETLRPDALSLMDTNKEHRSDERPQSIVHDESGCLLAPFALRMEPRSQRRPATRKDKDSGSDVSRETLSQTTRPRDREDPEIARSLDRELTVKHGYECSPKSDNSSQHIATSPLIDRDALIPLHGQFQARWQSLNTIEPSEPRPTMFHVKHHRPAPMMNARTRSLPGWIGAQDAERTSTGRPRKRCGPRTGGRVRTRSPVAQTNAGASPEP